ncbi:MAG: pyruvate, phosphate dikinase/phosphoenolpyruvate synthase regulator [candidate division Zixibacteria bacterium]|nr:pyruvate, phosphate dikinase/phosphoenolpyruvate synthase regulator [candidate division Zixibacteria bacterium]
MSELKKIVIVSDGTGGTAKRLMDAVLVQYDHANVEYSLEHIYQQVRTRREIGRILKEIDDEDLVMFSVISKELNDYFSRRLEDRNILHLNILQPTLNIVSKFLGVHPDYRPGIFRIVDDRYYGSVNTIAYTVEHDDGCGSLIEQADAVLLGLSRSCKTPISVYLACNHGLKVANIPVVRDAVITENLLRRLKSVDAKKIVGLLIQPDRLARMREERSGYFAVAPKARAELQSYHEIGEVTQEFRFCRELYRTKGWQTVDVTHRAIEEISKEILQLLGYPGSGMVE